MPNSAFGLRVVPDPLHGEYDVVDDGLLQAEFDKKASIAGLADGSVAVGSATVADSSNKVGVGPADHQITALWRGTQAEYDAISPKIETTLYVVVG